jgi:hypothetical protein
MLVLINSRMLLGSSGELVTERDLAPAISGEDNITEVHMVFS